MVALLLVPTRLELEQEFRTLNISSCKRQYLCAKCTFVHHLMVIFSIYLKDLQSAPKKKTVLQREKKTPKKMDFPRIFSRKKANRGGCFLSIVFLFIFFFVCSDRKYFGLRVRIFLSLCRTQRKKKRYRCCYEPPESSMFAKPSVI